MFSQTEESVGDIVPSLGLIIRAGSLSYRVSGSPGSEIAPCPALATVPQAPYWLLGIGFHKNEAIPVVHLQALLEGRARDPSRAARMLVVRDACPALGYLVDDVDADPGTDSGRSVHSDASAAIELDLQRMGHVLIGHAFLGSMRW